VTTGTGMFTTYDLVVGVMIDMDPLIQMLSPVEIPLQGGAGAEASLALSRKPAFEKKVEWLDEDILTPRSKIKTAGTNVQTWVEVTAGEAPRFQGGDIIKIGGEYLRVSHTNPYGTTADSLVVVRAYSGSAAALNVADEVIGVGSALSEGSDPPTERWTDRVARFNYTQIFGPMAVKSSETEIVVRKYGVANEFDHQAAMRTMEVGLSIEQALWYAVRAEDVTNKWRTMNGILNHITQSTNINSTTGPLTEAKELDQLQELWNQGGRPDVLAVSGSVKRYISTWTSTAQIQIQRADGTRGLQVDVFESDFGTIRLLKNRQLNVKDAVNFERSQATIRPLRPATFEMLAKTGDSRKGQIVSELSLQFIRARHAGKFTGLTAT
jgi:hypothetical protein